MVGYVIHYKKNKNNNNNNSSSSSSGSDGTDDDDDIVMVKEKEKEGKKMRRRGRDRDRRRRRPKWAERLVRGRYFGECGEHGGMRKGEENFFCVDCRRTMCFHCLEHAHHGGHSLLQIRKYVYRDVVRVLDLQKLLDLSGIQPYTVNGAKVVHLNPRDKSTPSKPNSGAPSCRICRQSVCSDLNRYCSVACKLSEEASEEEEPGPSDDNVAERSEPSIHDPTSELDENGTDKEANSSLVSLQNQQQQQEQQQPSDSGEENQGSRKQRRKGVPRRAPKF